MLRSDHEEQLKLKKNDETEKELAERWENQENIM